MRRLPATILLIVLVSACSARAETTDVRKEAIARAAAFLWSKQGPDGAWHSERYGLLRSGQSLTPFVLLALLDAPEPPASAVEAAFAFVRANLDRDGALGRADPGLEDYPTFATALAVQACERGGRKADLERLRASLARGQFQDAGGWPPEHPAHGAWGMGGPVRLPPHPGHLDLAMTRHALQAMAAQPASVARAKVFLERCQNPDGGFLFSTVVEDANKAGPGRSYGTATADGLLARLAVGDSPKAPRAAAALAWLTARHRVDGVPGFDEDGAKWRDGMLFYYLAVSAQAFQQTGGGPADWRQTLTTALAARQRKDGSFQNASFLMKEDDPLLATTLALTALHAAR